MTRLIKYYGAPLLLSAAVVAGAIRWRVLLPDAAHADVFIRSAGTVAALFRDGLEIKDLDLNGFSGSAVITSASVPPDGFLAGARADGRLDSVAWLGDAVGFGWKERGDGLDVCLAMKPDDGLDAGIQGLFRVPRIHPEDWSSRMRSAAGSERMPGWARDLALSTDVQHCGMTLAGTRYDLVCDRTNGDIGRIARQTAQRLAEIGWKGRRESVGRDKEVYMLKQGTTELILMVTPGDAFGTSDIFLVSTSYGRKNDG